MDMKLSKASYYKHKNRVLVFIKIYLLIASDIYAKLDNNNKIHLAMRTPLEL